MANLTLRHFLGLYFFAHSLKIATPEDVCVLKPLTSRLYVGLNKIDAYQAKACCENKHMNILTLSAQPDFTVIRLKQVRDAILANSLWWDELIGMNNPLHIEPQNRSGFEASVPWISTRPGDNLNRTGACTTVILRTPNHQSVHLNLEPCIQKHKFLCEDGAEKHESSRFQSIKGIFDARIDCSHVSFRLVAKNRLFLGGTKLTWKNAELCCSQIGAELIGPDLDIQSMLWQYYKSTNRIQRPFTWWTSGFKRSAKMDFKAEKTQSDFLWSNHENVQFEETHNSNNSEFCVAGNFEDTSWKIHLFPKDCESNLSVLCVKKSPAIYSLLSFKKLKVEGSQRTYFYIPDRLTWREAALACKYKNLQLFSVISASEGNLIASTFLENSQKEFIHAGLSYGVWTSGRKHDDPNELYEFISTKIKLETRKIHRHVLSFSAKDSEGPCLQFSVDAGNSFFLSGIPCSSLRSVICEEPLLNSAGISILDKHWIRELGNQYTMSLKKLTWRDSKIFCKLNYFNLFSTEYASKEENETLASLLATIQVEGITETLDGFWVDYTDHPIIPPDQKLYAVTNRILFLNESEQDLKMQCPYIQSDFMMETYRVNCSKKLNAICMLKSEKDCSKNNFRNYGTYILSNYKVPWLKAKNCCIKFGLSLAYFNQDFTDLGKFFSVAVTYYKHPNVGFWTSATNLILKTKFIWHGNGFVSDYEDLKPHLYYDAINSTSMEGDGLCLEMFINLKKLKLQFTPVDCNSKREFVCQNQELGYSRAGCSNIDFYKLDAYHFQFAKEKLSWIEAMECCRDHGMSMVELPDEETVLYLKMVYTHQSENTAAKRIRSFWIGLLIELDKLRTEPGYNITWAESRVPLIRSIMYSQLSISNASLYSKKGTKCVGAFGSTSPEKFELRLLNCRDKMEFICKKPGPIFF